MLVSPRSQTFGNIGHAPPSMFGMSRAPFASEHGADAATRDFAAMDLPMFSAPSAPAYPESAGESSGAVSTRRLSTWLTDAASAAVHQLPSTSGSPAVDESNLEPPSGVHFSLQREAMLRQWRASLSAQYQEPMLLSDSRKSLFDSSSFWSLHGVDAPSVFEGVDMETLKQAFELSLQED